MGSDLEDRCTWAGLAAMLSGTPLSTETLNAVFQAVTLDELKSAAKKMLDEASISVIPGS
jgi:hypothetical protein